MAGGFKMVKKLALLATLLACTGGGGPMGGSGPVGGALDSGGNYAAGPVSLPSPGTLNKNLIVCDNVSGPRVECRGSDGAAPANAKIKLTVYSRFSAIQKSWTDYIIPSAHALVGNTDFCDANQTGAFGQAGECSVVAAAGEKVGLCVAAPDNSCAGPELVLTVPVEGGSVSGGTGTIKSLSVDPDGSIILGRAPAKKSWSWTDLFFGTAHAEPTSSAPVLAIPPAVASTCVGLMVATAGPTAYQAPAGKFLVIKKKVGSGEPVDLFQIPGQQEDLTALYSGDINKQAFIVVALKNTIYMIPKDSMTVAAQIYFPGNIRSMEPAMYSLDLRVDVPKGQPSRYDVSKDYAATCQDTPESLAFTSADSFGRAEATQPDAEHGQVTRSISGGVGLNEGTGEYNVYLRSTGFTNVDEWDAEVYRQPGRLKNFQILSMTVERVVVAVLDPEQNRIVTIKVNVEGERNVVAAPITLGGITTMPVAMAVYDAKLFFLDSGEQGAQAVLVPFTVSEEGQVALSPAQAKFANLGPIVVNSIHWDKATREFVVYDAASADIVRFSPTAFGSR
ncbi:MAG TPA: hypothetical protein VJR29_11855 [bacterium]|nr:hypothetical protein [bacterium]